MKRKNIPKEKTEFARHLRQSQTSTEDLLWQLLRNQRSIPAKFRRQEPIGAYIVDICCYSHLSVVECDGEPHLTAQGIAHDQARDKYLARHEYTVKRFMNQEIEMDPQAVINAIQEFIVGKPSPPASLPEGEGS